MKCVICTSNYLKNLPDTKLDVDDHTIIIKNIPDNICIDSSNYEVNNHIATALQKINKNILDIKDDLTVINYTDIIKDCS